MLGKPYYLLYIPIMVTKFKSLTATQDEEDEQPSQSGFKPLEGLLGSSEGRSLRRLAYDVDIKALFAYLASSQGPGLLWKVI